MLFVQGGPKIREARKNAADAHEGGDVFRYRDSSAAPLFDLRRRIKAVMDVLDAMIRGGVSLARSVELTAQWDEILWIGSVNPVTLEDFRLGVLVLGCFVVLLGISIVGFLISFTGSSFTAGMRLFVGGGIGCVRILLVAQTCLGASCSISPV